jgi:hypothetical protein
MPAFSSSHVRASAILSQEIRLRPASAGARTFPSWPRPLRPTRPPPGGSSLRRRLVAAARAQEGAHDRQGKQNPKEYT